MEENKREKFKKIYRERGAVAIVAGSLFVVLKKFADNYRNIKLKKSLKRIMGNKKVILSKVNDYKMLLDSKKDGIHQELILNGIREPLATKEMGGVIKEGDVILEAGANIGYYALMESKLVGKKGQIYAVEPAKDNFEFLSKNIKENGCNNILASKQALGDKDKQVLLNIYEAENWNTLVDIPYAKKKAQEKVTLQTVDSFLKGKLKPNFVRMDVEGYEYEIFKGMKNLLEGRPPRGLFVEVHFYIMGPEKSIEFLRDLKNYGYEVKKYFLDKKPTPPIWFVDRLLNKLEQIKDGLPLSLGEVKNVKIEDLLKNKNNLRGGAPEIFFELKNEKRK